MLSGRDIGLHDDEARAFASGAQDDFTMRYSDSSQMFLAAASATVSRLPPAIRSSLAHGHVAQVTAVRWRRMPGGRAP